MSMLKEFKEFAMKGDVVDKIQNVPLKPDTSPKTPVVILSVKPLPQAGS